MTGLVKLHPLFDGRRAESFMNPESFTAMDVATTSFFQKPV